MVCLFLLFHIWWSKKAGVSGESVENHWHSTGQVNYIYSNPSQLKHLAWVTNWCNQTTVTTVSMGFNTSKWNRIKQNQILYWITGNDLLLITNCLILNNVTTWIQVTLEYLKGHLFPWIQCVFITQLNLSIVGFTYTISSFYVYDTAILFLMTLLLSIKSFHLWTRCDFFPHLLSTLRLIFFFF